jgi:hypothetical protein
MPHEPARTLQHTIGIIKLSAPKEPDIHVIFEHVNVAERRIIHARSRMPVVQQLPNVFSARTHDLKPALRDRSQFTGMFVHPDIDRWISFNRCWKPHQPGHDDFIDSGTKRSGMFRL